jgi:DNA recombination protein RmuC
MDPLLIALVVVNTLVTTGVLVVLLNRRPSSNAGALNGAELRQDLSVQRSELSEALRRDREERLLAHNDLIGQLNSLRRENESQLEKVRESVDEKLRSTISTSLQANADRIEALNAANSAKHVELQVVLREELDKLRLGNEAKLEQMRETVDEKLQGTLEKRLGESFTLVSTRLEEVQKGLGEMQTLATDVGGLKRVLTNVKNRGGWGEVQLSRQLEDILTPDQYAENVAVKPGSAERVEFAIKLPGRDDSGSILYLPIDSKFPQEDYERLLNAQEIGEKSGIDDAERKLERAIVEQAKIIAKKYIEPPHTTEFAIMYLPTEGLFAEVLRMPGLASKLANDLHISVAGPTTLMALLNSLQMGFRTLAIEKRSSEVWKVLAAAKSEFQKYGQVWDKLGKQLQTAQNTVAEAGRRTRVVERKLKSVESEDLGVKTPDLIESLLDDVEEIALISGPDAELSALDELPGVRRDEIESALIDLPAEAAKRKDGRTA